MPSSVTPIPKHPSISIWSPFLFHHSHHEYPSSPKLLPDNSMWEGEQARIISDLKLNLADKRYSTLHGSWVVSASSQAAKHWLLTRSQPCVCGIQKGCWDVHFTKFFMKKIFHENAWISNFSIRICTKADAPLLWRGHRPRMVYPSDIAAKPQEHTKVKLQELGLANVC